MSTVRTGALILRPGPSATEIHSGSDPATIVWVAKLSGDFKLFSAALTSIVDASNDKLRVIKVAPGVFVSAGGVTTIGLPTTVCIDVSNARGTDVDAGGVTIERGTTANSLGRSTCLNLGRSLASTRAAMHTRSQYRHVQPAGRAADGCQPSV
ncbi:MAG: pectin methylesterase-like acyl-CoA thioesterase [Ilumatobacter sp.]|jgi:pectin methylesterase-like acyl-CoA thioesterase